ncbi:hypothetical protein DYB32_008049 [Aphanomyces invadans]|uniref:Chromosome segregation in meiosis protein 3 domain-containing protein n=1 Tax=Aphanomyces invadans TaxID=157072 RepID=A0A3R6ZL68_9STRA|nr:hypothetical protein DYB32_008049 [Aphanomyces invadans]
MSGWEESSAVLGGHGDSASKKRDLEVDATEEDMPLGEENKEGDESVPLKAKKKRATFSEQHLLGPKGFSLVYSSFPTHFNGAVTNGNESEALRELITAYKEWAYELYPGLNFEDLVDRTEIIAKKATVSSYLSDLRQQERKRGEPVEPEPALPTAHEQWVAMQDYEAALKAQRESSESKPAGEASNGTPIRRSFHIEDEGEAEFELPTSVQQAKSDDSGSEAEFDFIAVSTRSQVDAPEQGREEERAAEEIDLPGDSSRIDEAHEAPRAHFSDALPSPRDDVDIAFRRCKGEKAAAAEMATKRGMPTLDTASAAAVQQNNLRIIETFIASENSRELQLAQCKSVEKRGLLEMEFALARAHESKLLHRMMQQKGDSVDTYRLEEEVNAMLLASSKRIQEIVAKSPLPKSTFAKKHPAKKRAIPSDPTAAPPFTADNATLADPTTVPNVHVQLTKTLPEVRATPAERTVSSPFESFFHAYMGTPSELLFSKVKEVVLDVDGYEVRVRKKSGAAERPATADTTHGVRGVRALKAQKELEEVQKEVNRANGAPDESAKEMHRIDDPSNAHLDSANVTLDPRGGTELRDTSSEETEGDQANVVPAPSPAKHGATSDLSLPPANSIAEQRGPHQQHCDATAHNDATCEDPCNECGPPDSPSRLAQVHDVSVVVVDAIVANALHVLSEVPPDDALEESDGFAPSPTNVAPLSSPDKAMSFHAPNTQDLLAVAESFMPSHEVVSSQPHMEAHPTALDNRSSHLKCAEAAVQVQRMVRGHQGRKHFQATLYEEAQSCGVLGAMPGTTQGATGWYQEQATFTAHYFVVLPSGEWRPKVKVACPHMILTTHDMKRLVHDMINVMDMD